MQVGLDKRLILLDIGMTSNLFASWVLVSWIDVDPFDAMVEMLDEVGVWLGHRSRLVLVREHRRVVV
jgi:hypothetical protein